MNATDRLGRLRLFLFALAAALFAGTVLELLAVSHTGSRLQLLPFALCGLGMLAAAIAWARPTPRIVLGARVLMALIAAGSLWGVYAHLEGNYAFASEIRPRESTVAHLRSALTGRDPLMAPGILAIGAMVTIAATYAAGTGEERIAG